MNAPPLRLDNVRTRLGGRWVHDGLSFTVERGEVVALIGSSGAGKTLLLRECIGLLPPASGRIELFGQDIWRMPGRELDALRRRFGVLFQEGALFTSLTVGENVATPLRERGGLAKPLIDQLVALHVGLAGLPSDAIDKRPSELSGGMRKRAALARALALEPELLFLDEPTSGLDPISAREFDHLVRVLCDSLGLTAVIATHDLDTLWGVVDRVIVLHDGKLIADGPVAEVAKTGHEWIRSYFSAQSRAQGKGQGHGT